jgi:hypothetical protein
LSRETSSLRTGTCYFVVELDRVIITKVEKCSEKSNVRRSHDWRPKCNHSTIHGSGTSNTISLKDIFESEVPRFVGAPARS